MPIERQSEQWPHRREAMVRAAGWLFDDDEDRDPNDFFDRSSRRGTCTMCKRPRALPPGPFCSHGEGDEEFRRRLELDPTMPYRHAYRTAVDWSQPRFVDEKRNPSFYHPTEFTDRNHFSPETFNPPADNAARPLVRWVPTEPEQDTLNLKLPTHFSSDPSFSQHDLDKVLPYWSDDHIYPVDRQPQKLYRAINLDMNHPDLHPVRRALFGSDDYGASWNPHGREQQPGLFPAADVPGRRDPRGFRNTDLGPAILDHLTNNDFFQGLGRHWTKDPEIAKSEFGGKGFSNNIPVLLSAEWMGRGEDPYRTNTGGNYPDEKELTMMPGAPLRITDMHLKHPYEGSWHSVFSGPGQDRHAALDPEQVPFYARDKYPHWREQLPPELANHYDQHPEQEINDFPAQINQRAAPWQKDENRSLYSGPESFVTPRYPQINDRPRLQEHGGDFRFRFAPDEVNPPAKNPARPDLQWTPEQLDQDPLPGVDWPKGRSTPLYRGILINLQHHPELARAVDSNHPELGKRVLDHLTSYRGYGGTGTHWSSDPAVAQEYAEKYSSPDTLPVVMSTQWRGAGEDPYRTKSYGNFPEAKEITLLPGAKTPIDNVSILHPHTGLWHSLGEGGQDRQAARS